MSGSVCTLYPYAFMTCTMQNLYPVIYVFTWWKNMILDKQLAKLRSVLSVAVLTSLSLCFHGCLFELKQRGENI